MLLVAAGKVGCEAGFVHSGWGRVQGMGILCHVQCSVHGPDGWANAWEET